MSKMIDNNKLIGPLFQKGSTIIFFSKAGLTQRSFIIYLHQIKKASFGYLQATVIQLTLNLASGTLSNNIE
jgi:hypothetical protein